ncbi:hypothetical protein [uncultured Christiangramia sp.]|uniref:hypothetical protein n=1 Tax=Christiangramia sp. 3-2217-3z TaxID=3417564 RepID=UPI0025E9F0FA|nr:hypothetical protein [uncultured Christiangramia sp.]
MRRFFEIMIVAILFVSCQDDEQKELNTEPVTAKVQDSLEVLQGDYVYVADAAVLRGENFVYGVKQDSVAMLLSDKVSDLKSDDFEMIPVRVKAKILANPRLEGWDEIIEIKEILEISGASISDSIE